MMAQIVEDPWPDHTPRLSESEPEFLEQSLDIGLGTLDLGSYREQLGNTHRLSDNNAARIYDSLDYLERSACPSFGTDSQRATCGSSSIGVTSSSDTLIGQASEGMYAGFFRQYIDRPCRNVMLKCSRLRPSLSKKLKTVFGTEKAAKGMRIRIQRSVKRR